VSAADGGTRGGALTPSRVLDTAEEVLRRYGLAKTTVVDVARALGVSHGSVYRHFPSKSALRDAVARRWLARVSRPLHAIAEGTGGATVRLHAWLRELSAIKRRMAREDPELFATYHRLAVESGAVVATHVDELAAQVARIVADGLAAGEFTVADPAVTARAVLNATSRFHNPVNAADWDSPGLDAEFDAVWRLLLHGLSAPAAATPPG
jgi:AcrR family transcriptional regulator